MGDAGSRAPAPSKRLGVVDGNVWEFIGRSLAESCVQPVVDAGLGHVEFAPPSFLVEAHKQALDDAGVNQYGPPNGLPPFRQAISDAYSPLYGRAIDPDEEVSVHTGGTEALLSCFAAFLEPGDEVIVIEPAFDLYWRQIGFLGASVKPVTLHPPTGDGTAGSSAKQWTLDIGELEAAIGPKTKMLVTCSPSNPLGKVYAASELLQIGNICIKHDLLIVSDEVYEFLQFEPAFSRIAAQSRAIFNRTMTVSSLGKAMNATGWRIGYTVGPSELLRQVKHAHIMLGYTSPTPAQVAGAVCLGHPDKQSFFDWHISTVKSNIERLCAVLSEVGLCYVEPSGAPFLFVCTGAIKIPAGYSFPSHVREKPRDWQMSWFLIRQIGLATIPGGTFCSPQDTPSTRDYVRIVVCKEEETMDLIVNRLKMLRSYIA